MNKISALTFIVYLSDVTIDTLVNVLDGFGYPYAISPLHNKDKHLKGQKKGLFKEPHYHIMVQHNIKESVRHKINRALGIRENMPWFPVRNQQAMYDYFFHKNVTEYKAEYSEDDMIISDSFSLDFSNPVTKSTLKTVIDLIENEHLDNYYKMARYFLEYPDNDVTEWVFRNDAKLRTYIFFMTGGRHSED